ncbi:anti-sigma factor [Neobacillus novalis]|uniref:Anti-sigma factor n=1 Tax=Neobacillus novalis TaxID=220687 RepID=A0AA95MUF4_9BACI|nr:anti-sigma factor [Neobacillus novalis]WHY86628.1 anti-sigma factor [Neobacillus novalis]
MSDKHDEEKDYQQYLQESLKEINDFQPYTEADQTGIIKLGKQTARRTNIMISLAILLLVVPLMTLASYMYYATGDRANQLINVAARTIYVTEPNMGLEELRLEHKIGFFSMNINFDVFKRIGKEDYKVGSYDIDFMLDQPDFPKRSLILDRPLDEYPSKETEFMVHPKATLPLSAYTGWDMLKRIPDGSVAEIYVSLNQVMKPEELKEILPKNMELRWLAVDTGMDAAQVDQEGVPITPLGYPAQYDPTTWSPFKTDDNERAFLEILLQLKNNEAVATKVARAKSLALGDRLAYIKKHGINVYGAVITGPTEELRKLQNLKEIRAVKVGEVKLWNWE